MLESEYNIEAIEVTLLILSLDTTTRGGSVALIRDGRVVFEQAGNAERTHTERLPSELMSACDAGGVGIAEVELFAVAVGPGSFTGLRMGIATVQGLAMARDRLVVPVSTLQALAAAAPGNAGRIAAWMDAQRGEVFAQMFDRTPAGEVPLGDAVSAPPEAVLTLHASLLESATFHGDGAARYRERIVTALGETACPIDPVRPLAGAIGLIAARDPERAILPHAIAPIYVRRPDVEITRDRRAGTT